MQEVHWAAYSLPLLENCETPELKNVSTACFPVKITRAFTVAKPIVRKILSNSFFIQYMPHIKELFLEIRYDDIFSLHNGIQLLTNRQLMLLCMTQLVPSAVQELNFRSL